MKNKFILLVVLIITSLHSHARPRITTSITPLASLVSMLTENSADINSINIDAGCPHDYQMKPSDKDKILSADLLIYIDDQFDGYAKNYVSRLGDKIVNVSDIQSINFTDENGLTNWHFWLDLNNVQALQHELAKTIKTKIPSLSKIIDDNENKAYSKIESLKQLKKQELADIGEIIVLSESLDHFVKDINNPVIKLYQKSNMSLQAIDNLEHILNTNQSQCILIDNTVDPAKYKKFNKQIIQLDSENWQLGDDMSNSYDLFCTKYLKMINQFKSCRKYR